MSHTHHEPRIQLSEARIWELYVAHLKQNWGDTQNSVETFDRSLLAVSSGVFGISFAFIKDIVPLHQAHSLWLLLVGWGFLGVCIILTVFSFRLSAATHMKQPERLRHYFVLGDDSRLRERDNYSKSLFVFNVVAGTAFVAGFIGIVLFCFLNLIGGTKMSDGTKLSRLLEGNQAIAVTNLETTTVSTDGMVYKGAQPIAMTPITVEAPPAATAAPAKSGSK